VATTYPGAGIDDIDLPSAALEPVPQGAHWSRVVLVLLGGLVVAAVVAVVSLASGDPQLSPAEAWKALSGDPAIDETTRFVVQDLRLPRLIGAFMAGAALALAGVILQDSLRNPIADPSLLGISEAAVIAVTFAVLVPGFSSAVGTPILAMIAGMLAGGVIVLFARSIRDSVRLILIGAVLALLLTAVTTTMVLFLFPDASGGEVAFLLRYTTGSVSAVDWDDVRAILPWLLVAVPLALLSGRSLNLLQLGDDMAIGLGMRVTRARLLLFVVAMLLVAPVVAVTGPIAFVAFLSPHIARYLVRTSNAYAVLPVSLVVGGIVVALADLLGRLLFYPVEIPAGIWTVVIAGPIAVAVAGTRLRGGQAAGAPA
jgi:iron complex transport system permease protein